MTAREKIIDIASKQIGVKESPANSNNVLYNTWFYDREVHDGDKPGATYSWCGTFVSWVFFMAGFPLPHIGYTRGYAGCATAVENVNKWGKIIVQENALPGDVLFYSWDGNKIDHTGIYKNNIGNGMLSAIEGNTGIGSDSNGGEVMLRQRRWSCVKAIVRPNIIENIKI